MRVAVSAAVLVLLGFTLDPMASTSDLQCDFAPAVGERVVSFTTTMTSVPYLAGERKVDGMNREGFEQPMSSNGDLRLASGTTMRFPRSSTAANVRAAILAPGTLKPLVKASQP